MPVKQKKFADDGWAIWIDGDDVSTVYINDWLNPKGKSYIDMAIRIRGVKASKCLHVYVPFAISSEEIEDVSLLFNDKNILQATFLAMRRAAQKLTALENAVALIDGPHKCAGLTLRQLPVVDGDAKSLCVAAASIIAKVTRDRYMDTLEKLYPH